jgi:hypothetical protein
MKTLQRVEPLLCNNCKVGGYTRAVPGQRLGKHVLRAMYRRPTMQVLLETVFFYVARAEMLQARDKVRDYSVVYVSV